MFVGLIFISIIRSIIVTNFDLSAFGGSHLWLILPDMLFLTIMWVWYSKKRYPKKALTQGVFLYFLAYIGSFVWDYQEGFHWLKFLVFPGLLYVITHQVKFNTASLQQAVLYSFPILNNPIYSIKQFFNELWVRNTSMVLNHSSAETKAKSSANADPLMGFSFLKALWLGLAFGVFVLLLLATLDPDFASFLKITEWWDIVNDSFASLIYYLFMFFWFFWKPVTANWEENNYNPALSTLLHRAVVMVVGIFVGYTLYDSYILLRALKLIELTFETVGRNTQMNFLELVILGGGWLFLAAFFINQLQHKTHDKKSRIFTIITLLAVSCILLLPPVFNILRVLLDVYIPRYGLTARRLFGLYTTIAFLMTLGYVLYAKMKMDSLLFARAVIVFFIYLVVCSFVIPTNLIIGSWHFYRYLDQKPQADYQYFKKLQLKKWGWIFEKKLQPDVYKSDLIWGLTLAGMQDNKDTTNFYLEKIRTEVRPEINEIFDLLTTAQFDAFEEKYGLIPAFNNTNYRPKSLYLSQSQEEAIKSVFNNLQTDVNTYQYLNSVLYLGTSSVSWLEHIDSPVEDATRDALLRRIEEKQSFKYPANPTFIFTFSDMRSDKRLLKLNNNCCNDLGGQ